MKAKREGITTTGLVGAVVAIAIVVGGISYYLGNSGFKSTVSTSTDSSITSVTTLLATTTSFETTSTSTSIATSYVVNTTTTTVSTTLTYVSCPGQASPPCLPDLDGDGA